MVEYIDRTTGKVEKEEVYYEGIIRFFYGKSFYSRLFGRAFLEFFFKWPIVSWFFGVLQKTRFSARRVIPFIEKYKVDTSEFELSPKSFKSFNDFFIRKLKPDCRPIALGKNVACIPADGRYEFYNGIGEGDVFSVKGESLFFEELFQSEKDAKSYHNGSIVLGRLCPTDCHRFYFPFDCVASSSTLIPGKLYSVNPIATSQMPWIFYRNRRWITFLKSDVFGDVAFIEVGATMVGSVTHTNRTGALCKKGDEKGYFSFGGSFIMIIFKENSIQFSKDLLDATKKKVEIRCLIGQEMGIAII